MVAALLAFVVGCGNGRPATYPVTGSVTYQGQPVVGAQVMFRAAGAPAAEGTTDGTGKFSLMTFDPNDGAVLGKHRVTVVKKVPLDPNDPYSAVKDGLPAIYGDMARSPLEKEVTSGMNDFALELKD